MVHRMIAEWTYSSKVFSTAVVKRGLMIQHIEKLPELQKAYKSLQIANTFAEVNLSILYNCACATSIKDYFIHPSYDCAQILIPFTQSSEYSIRIHAVFVLSHLSQLFASQHIDLVQLCPEDMYRLLSAFEYASTAGDHKACLPGSTRIMSVPEMTDVLVTLQTNETNFAMMIDRNILPTLASLLVAEGFEERLSGCRLLWSLLHHSAFRAQVCSSDLPIAEMVQMLREDPQEDVCQIALCTLFSLEGTEEKDTSLHLEVARGCYRYGYYSECSELCKNIINEKTATQPEKNQGILLLGKASFHLYRQMQFELEKEKRLQRHYTAPYRAKHKQCYEKAKVAIGKLGAAMDGNFLEKKEEELRMLDIAMIDYLQETNKLERCLLCRKHTKLLKSHCFPKSLLKDFCSGLDSADDQKVMLPYITYQGACKSPKEIVYFMFCHECEEYLSKHGETQFRPKFFSRMYDPTNPLQRKAEQCIEYGNWLYEFCLGIILRGLAVCRKNYMVNSEQVHDLFHKCRHFLLNPDSKHEDNPAIAIFISPPEASPEISGDVNPGVVHAFVTYGHLYSRLDDSPLQGPPSLHSFVVHFAEINIAALLNEGDIQWVPKECLIMRKGGTCIVPDEESRWQKTPKAIIKGLQKVAMGMGEVYLGLGAKLLQEYERKREKGRIHHVPGHLKETFLISARGEGAETDREHQLPKAVKPLSDQVCVNLLPEQFVVRPSHDKSSVHLPNGHQILFHVNFEISDDVGDTIFLAVGSGGPYSLERPYLIHHHYEPKALIHVGYFVTPVDFSAQEFLPDKYPKQTLKENTAELELIENFQSQCPQVLCKIFEAKGFINWASLLRHIQAQSEINNYDLKCTERQQCWYCANLCEVCMKPASFGFASERDDGYVLRFCSESCQAFERVSPIKEPAFTTEIWTPPTPPVPHFRAFPVSETHKTLLCIEALGMSPHGNYTRVNLAICAGDGKDGYPVDKPYVALAIFELHHQMFIEFFVSDDGEPEMPLPYAVNETAMEITKMLHSTNQVRYFISLALLTIGIPNLRPLLHNN